jgi:hypothetical protein
MDRGGAHAGNEPVVLTIGLMVNTSIAYRLLDDEADEGGSWIIVYDFKGVKPNPNFWAKLKRISGSRGGGLIQYSVYRARRHSEARAISGLVRHYGGEAKEFRCVEANI